jgi:hypothetical protein
MKEKEFIHFPPRETKRLRDLNQKKGDDYFKRMMKESTVGKDDPVSKDPPKRKSAGSKNYD